jgi:hypothetical protein
LNSPDEYGKRDHTNAPAVLCAGDPCPLRGWALAKGYHVMVTVLNRQLKFGENVEAALPFARDPFRWCSLWAAGTPALAGY